MGGCGGYGIAFGGGGEFYKIDCQYQVRKYLHRGWGGWSQPLSAQRAYGVAVGADGLPWIRSVENSILKWDREKWLDMQGPIKSRFIAAGGEQVYVLAPPGDLTIYRFGGGEWLKVEGKMTEEVSVGYDG